MDLQQENTSDAKQNPSRPNITPQQLADGYMELLERAAASDIDMQMVLRIFGNSSLTFASCLLTPDQSHAFFSALAEVSVAKCKARRLQ